MSLGAQLDRGTDKCKAKERKKADEDEEEEETRRGLGNTPQENDKQMKMNVSVHNIRKEGQVQHRQKQESKELKPN